MDLLLQHLRHEDHERMRRERFYRITEGAGYAVVTEPPRDFVALLRRVCRDDKLTATLLHAKSEWSMEAGKVVWAPKSEWWIAGLEAWGTGVMKVPALMPMFPATDAAGSTLCGTDIRDPRLQYEAAEAARFALYGTLVEIADRQEAATRAARSAELDGYSEYAEGMQDWRIKKTLQDNYSQPWRLKEDRIRLAAQREQQWHEEEQAAYEVSDAMRRARDPRAA